MKQGHTNGVSIGIAAETHYGAIGKFEIDLRVFHDQLRKLVSDDFLGFQNEVDINGREAQLSYRPGARQFGK